MNTTTSSAADGLQGLLRPGLGQQGYLRIWAIFETHPLARRFADCTAEPRRFKRLLRRHKQNGIELQVIGGQSQAPIAQLKAQNKASRLLLNFGAMKK